MGKKAKLTTYFKVSSSPCLCVCPSTFVLSTSSLEAKLSTQVVRSGVKRRTVSSSTPPPTRREVRLERIEEMFFVGAMLVCWLPNSISLWSIWKRKIISTIQENKENIRVHHKVPRRYHLCPCRISQFVKVVLVSFLVLGSSYIWVHLLIWENEFLHEVIKDLNLFLFVAIELIMCKKTGEALNCSWHRKSKTTKLAIQNFWHCWSKFSILS